MRNIIFPLLFLALFFCKYVRASNKIAYRDSTFKWAISSNLEEISKQATEHQKLIFIDCYATWCAPCHRMDAEVFTDKEVANALNDNFICVRLQMDTTKKDDNHIRKWHKVADSLKRKFGIRELPTFLILGADLKPLTEDVGYKDKIALLDFLESSKENPKQYLLLLKAYLAGDRNYSPMPFMARRANNIGDKALAINISKYYIKNYLLKLPKSQILSTENIGFLTEFMENSKSESFRFFYLNSKDIDNAVNAQGYSAQILDQIIFKEIVFPEIDKALKEKQAPNWKKLSNTIQRKFNVAFAQRNVLDAKDKYFSLKEDWPKLHSTYQEKLRLYKVDAVASNNMAWNVFEHSFNKDVLAVMVKQMSTVVDQPGLQDGTRANMIDTYANLLYKSGDVANAIIWEKKAVELATKNNWHNWENSWKKTIIKMENGERTWPNEK